MDEKQFLEKQLKKSLEILRQLPENRRFFINTGFLMVEVTREEAEKYLQKEMEGLGGNFFKNDREVKP